jgi:hypothetical protein
VATTADSYSVKRAVAAPVSTHPAFPAIVALWFAALLGIGSLVLPVALIERLVSVTGLAAVFPVAAPPLGFTARAGIALGGAIAGALVGLALARKVAQAHAPEPKARSFAYEEVRQCRPISAHDELGEEGLGSAPEPAPAQAHKRRTLAIAEDNARSTYLQTVPTPGLPADEPPAFAQPAAFAPPAEQPGKAEPGPLELDAFAELDVLDELEPDQDHEAAESAANDALDALKGRIHSPVDTPSVQDQPMTDRSRFDDPQAPEPAADAADPLPFAAPSLRRAEALAFDEEEVADEAIESSFEETPSAPQLSVIQDFGEPEEGDDERPLDELGLVQLAARLGASLAKRTAWLASQPQAATPATIAPFAGTEDFEAAEADDAARAIADFFGPANSAEPDAEYDDVEPEPATAAVPASLRALSFESDEDFEDDGIAASFSLPLGAGYSGAELVDEDEAVEPDELAEDSDYSSLLGMKNPFARQQEFVRIEETEDDDAAEPAVTFPSPAPAQPAFAAEDQPASQTPRPFDPPRNRGQIVAQGAAPAAPRDSGDAERNLRAALATLQRMSGAA